MRPLLVGAALIGGTAAPAWAHGVNAGGAGSAWPEIVLALLLAVVLGRYLDGLASLRRRARAGRSLLHRRAVCFLAGCLALAVALLSPLHGLAERFFWVHMIEHELLMVVAAPLLVAARPAAVLLWSVPLAWRTGLSGGFVGLAFRRVWDAMTRPLVAWSLHTAALWLWHLPSLFDAALDSEFVHALQHTTFLAVAIVYWSSLVRARHGLASRGAAVFSLFATSMQCGVLGALLALGPRPLYAAYTRAPALDPVVDQHLAGLVMWVPVSVIYGVAAIPLLLAWLREADGRVRRWEVRL
jgi:cytochrome c oxidase assembly factor CtaG